MCDNNNNNDDDEKGKNPESDAYDDICNQH